MHANVIEHIGFNRFSVFSFLILFANSSIDLQFTFIIYLVTKLILCKLQCEFSIRIASTIDSDRAENPQIIKNRNITTGKELYWTLGNHFDNR